MALNQQLATFYATWLSAMGVSDTPAETPTNFYQIKPAKTAAPTIAQSPTASKKEKPLLAQRGATQGVPIAKAVAEAETLAAQANSLEGLRQAIESFSHCSLKDTARNLVFADGNPKARVMLIGEAPGEQEDRNGVPFVGQAGKLLDRMLAAIELSREQVYITNLLPWRPPANRNPLPEERAMFRPFLNKHIELVAPKIIVLLGAIATKEMLATTQGITQLRGQWQKLKVGGGADRGGGAPATTYDVLPTFHPAFLLRQQGQKKLSWEDLQSLQKKLAEIE